MQRCFRIKNVLKYLRQDRWIIAGLLAAACLIYLPMIANELTNVYDGLWSANQYQAGNWELSLGRWLWPFLDKLRFGLSTEPFISILFFVLFEQEPWQLAFF